MLTFSAAHYWAKAFPTLPLTPKTHPPPNQTAEQIPISEAAEKFHIESSLWAEQAGWQAELCGAQRWPSGTGSAPSCARTSARPRRSWHTLWELQRGLSPQISRHRTVYSWSNMPCWHQGCSSPTSSGICRLEALAAISNGLRAPCALPFSSQAFSRSDSFHVKKAQSLRLRYSGVLTHLSPDGTAPLKSTQERRGSDYSLSIL